MIEGISESFHLKCWMVQTSRFYLFVSSEFRNGSVLALTDQADAALDEAFEGRPHCNRPRKVAFGIGFHSLLEPQKSAVGVSFRMMWIDLDGFIEVGHRTLLVAFRYLCNSAVVVGHDVTAIAFHCLVEVRQRAIQIAFIEAEISAVVPGHR